MTDATKLVDRPPLLFRPDPVLGWSLSPDHGVRVGFRPGVVQTVDSEGWRHLPDRPASGPSIAVYGCSFTYGTGLADDETFTARLQRAQPHLRILNRGIGGHGTVQNLLQFRRDIARGAVDAAVFAMISDHRFRNIAHPHRMRQFLSRSWLDSGIEQAPVARLDANGRVRIVYHPIWQPVLDQADFDIFLPDDYMITAASLAVMELVRDTARAAGIPIRFVLLDSLDPDFNASVMARSDDCVDISTPYDEAHTFLPDDIHPNVAANAVFAAGLAPVIETLAQMMPVRRRS